MILFNNWDIPFPNRIKFVKDVKNVYSWHSESHLQIKTSFHALKFDLWQVLDYECHNVKALYRRAQAYMEIADLISAELDIRKAIEADPQNR